MLLAVQAAAPPAGVPDLTATDWAVAAGMATDWYAAAITGQRPDSGPFTRALTTAMARHADGPRILILRDYHAGNLIWLPDRKGAARVGLALDLDGALTPTSVNDDLINLIERAGPYGQGNPQPRFVFPAHRVRFAKVVGEAHIRCTLEAGDGSRLDAVAFRAAGQPVGNAILESAGMPIHVAGNLRRDTWNGRNKLELVIEDVADPRRQG